MPVRITQIMDKAAKDTAAKDASNASYLKQAQGDIIKKQQRGMGITSDIQNWEQAWSDVRNARSKSADAYKANRQQRSTARHQ